MIDIDIILDIISVLGIAAIIIIGIFVIEYKQKKIDIKWGRRKTDILPSPFKESMQEPDYLTNELKKANRSFDYTRGHIQVFTQKGAKENKLDD